MFDRVLIVYDPDDAKNDLRKGRKDVHQIFTNLQEYLRVYTEKVEEIRDIFTIMCKHGLEIDAIKQWVQSHIRPALIRDIVEYAPEDWALIGIDPDDYIDSYLKEYGDAYFSTYHLDCLPPSITMERLISYYKPSDILALTKEYGFSCFLDEYIACDGDIDAFAIKFFEELGYNDDYREEIVDLIVVGANIDMQSFISCLDIASMENSDKEFYHEILERAGATEEMLAVIA